MTKLKCNRLALIVAGIFFAASASSPVNAAPAATTAEEFAHYRAAANYSRAHNGEATLVLVNGNIVFEDYYNGLTRDKPHDLASGTKSFWGVAAVACEADGTFRLDDYVSSTISEWKTDNSKRRITIRQLLNLTSGIEPALNSLDGPRVGDKYAAACRLPSVCAPGKKFAYGASNLFVFGALLKRKAKRDPVTFLRARILKPAGIDVGWWRSDRCGQSSMPAGCGMTARNWAKFGWLVCNDGRLPNGETLVPAGQLRKCFQGSKANPTYGLGFWLKSDDPFGANAGLPSNFHPTETVVMAAGAGNQRLYVMPKRHMVVVHFGKPNGFRSDVFLSLLLDGREDKQNAESK